MILSYRDSTMVSAEQSQPGEHDRPVCSEASVILVPNPAI